MGMPVEPVFSQLTFRGRSSVPNPTGINAAFDAGDPAIGGDWTQDADTVFRVRFVILQSIILAANSADMTQEFALQYNYDGGGWNPVVAQGAGTDPVQFADGDFADGDDTTQLVGSAQFVTGDGVEVTPSDTITFTDEPGVVEETEIEFAVEIVSGQVADGLTLQLRVIYSAGDETPPATAFGTYTDTPTITVNLGATPITISMSAATLVASAQALDVKPGARSISMSEATLVGDPQALTVDNVPPPTTIPMTAPSLVSAAQALDVIPGGATVPMNAVTLASAAQALNVAPGAVTAPMSAVTLVSAAQALNVDISTGVTVSMNAAILVAAAQALGLILGPISVPMSAVTLASVAQTLTVDMGIPTPPARFVNMLAATLVSSAQALTVIPPPPTIAMSPTTLVGSAQQLTAKPGAVTIPLSAITLVSSAQNARLVAITRIGLQAITLQAQPQAARIAAGQTVIPMQAVTLTAVLLTLNRVGLPLAKFFRIYALLGEHTPETAYNLQGEHIVAGTLEGEHIPETEVEIDGEV